MLLQFQNYNKYGRPIKDKGAYLSLFLPSVYRPWRGEDYSRFNQVLDDFIGNVKDSANIFIGADINTEIGVRDYDKYKDILGPNDISTCNEKGKSLLSIYCKFELNQCTQNQRPCISAFCWVNPMFLDCVQSFSICSSARTCRTIDSIMASWDIRPLDKRLGLIRRIGSI